MASDKFQTPDTHHDDNHLLNGSRNSQFTIPLNHQKGVKLCKLFQSFPSFRVECFLFPFISFFTQGSLNVMFSLMADFVIGIYM